MKIIVRLLLFTSLMICNGVFAMKTAVAVTQDAVKNIVSTRADANAIALRLQQLNTTGIDDLIESLSRSGGQKQNKGKSDVVTTTTTTTPTPISGDANATDNNLDAQIMSVIQKVNPVLMQFGKDHNIAVPDLLKYAQILQEYHIDPAGIVAFVNQFHQLSSDASNDLEQHYRDVQANNPNEYMQLMLSCVKTIEDGVAGKLPTIPLLHTSTIDALHQMHTTQQGTIANQKSTIFIGKIGYLVHGLITLGFVAWSIYGQIGASIAAVNGTMA